MTVTDANGVAISQTFDWLDRLKTRTYPGGGVETFNYSERGLTNYVDQLNKTTTYTYNEALRKTSQTTPNNETISYTYNAAGDLLTLTDAKSNQRKWVYDTEGRWIEKWHPSTTKILTNSFDANGRLTLRWSAAKGITSYSYDDVGNLTFNDYPAGTTDITYQYDALNRITNMVDAAGTTKFTFTDSGQLLTEDGPWASDTVTYGYNTARGRSSLTLQQPVGSWSQTYGYDGAHRLTSLTSGAGTFTYVYSSGGTPAPASRFWVQLNLPNTSKIANSYDSNLYLAGTASITFGATLTGFNLVDAGGLIPTNPEGTAVPLLLEPTLVPPIPAFADHYRINGGTGIDRLIFKDLDPGPDELKLHNIEQIF